MSLVAVVFPTIVLCIIGHAKQQKKTLNRLFWFYSIFTLSVIPLKRRLVFHGGEGRPEDIAAAIRCCASEGRRWHTAFAKREKIIVDLSSIVAERKSSYCGDNRRGTESEKKEKSQRKRNRYR
jgi:hypothetical protein